MIHPRFCRLGLLFVCIVLVGSCGGSDDTRSALAVPDGFTTTLFADSFDGPTQMALTPNQQLVVAELNGGENDAEGRVLLVDLADPTSRVVLQDGLDKPTGVAVTGDTLWIMVRTELLRTTLEPNAPLIQVTGEMPFNGRSQGTLTVTDDDRLIFNTSGRKRGSDRTPGSGTIFVIENASTNPSEPVEFATGFKHAYAHLVDEAGQLWSVEMTDGNFDEQRASDELVAVGPGDDAGWPFCVENNRPVAEYGGTAAMCAAVPESHALFGAGATPTSFVVPPWNSDVFLVALWLPGEVVEIPRSAPAGTPHSPTVFTASVESPQHLLVHGDTVLLSDHATGQIFSIEDG